MFRSCLQHCWYSCSAWSLIECRCGAVMSGGSGTGYPVMNRGLRCAQTGRSERKRGIEEAQTAGENKTILLVQGRRGGSFFSSSSFFFPAGANCCSDSAASSRWSCIICSGPVSWERASGSRSVFCQLFVMKKEKQLRELLSGGHCKSRKF